MVERKLYGKKIEGSIVCYKKEDLKKYEIDFVIVGNENYLADGFVNEVSYDCFGPTKEAAYIESSKAFAKQFMKNNNIPTPVFIICYTKADAFNFLKNNFTKCNKYVIKLDELASGKGVFIPKDLDDALKILHKIYLDRLERTIVIEERLYGEEVSVMAFCNGHDVELMPQIQDHKKIHDNDEGANTGGMGAIGPVQILNNNELNILKLGMEKIVRQLNFKGVLYAGVLKWKDNFHVLEFNCRFGDPETQVVLNLLDSNLYQIMKDCINGNKLNVTWKKDKYCANVVLAHKDYPRRRLKNPVEIKISEKIEDNIKLYWYNTNEDNYHTTGGRVVSVVNISNNLKECLENIYNNTYKIKYDGCYYRRDIGIKYLLSSKLNFKPKVAIIGSSKGTSIKKLLDCKDIDTRLIISNKFSAILIKGQNKKIPTFYLPTTENFYENTINIIDMFEVDIILAVGFMKIFPSFFCDYYKGKLFNIHPSLLPDYGKMYGFDIHKKVFKNQEYSTGCTIHQITAGVDEGRIKLQKQFRIVQKGPEKLKEAVQEKEADALIEFVKLESMKNINYYDTGVDIKKADQFIETIKNEDIGGFCNIEIINGVKFGSTTDGVGTKLELARKYNKYENIGIDLVAMSVNDLIVRGIRPKIFLDYIAMGKINTEVLNKIIVSIKKGCQLAGCKLVGGETAEMPGVYGYNKFDLAGFATGVLENDIFPKVEIKSGCKIYGLPSNGFHSNGFSLIRKILDKYEYDIDEIMKPTKIYTECFDIMKKYEGKLLALAHITGGGLIDNIKRVIPENLYPQINIDFKNEFSWIKEKANLTEIEMLTTFNCGYGIALIFEKDFITDEFTELGQLYEL